MWLRLLVSCAEEDPSSQVEVLYSLAEQLGGQLELTAQLRQQVSELQQQLAAQQQVIAHQASQLLAHELTEQL